MKQLSLDPSQGRLRVQDVPVPRTLPGSVLVRVTCSAVSPGTESSKVALAEKSLLEKARERPDQVAQVLTAVRSEGPAAAFHKVRERLAVPQPLGYSLAGTIIGLHDSVTDFRSGDVVACAGVAATHAEIASIPSNLAVRVPAGVELSDAAFTTIGSIALHGIRTGNVVLGDRVLIIGLGLIGQLTLRLCVAAGAHVFGVDPRRDRVDLALQSGAEAADRALDKATAQQVFDWSAGRGADVVLITAGGADNQPLVLAGAAARDRAKVVVVGAVDLDVPREPFYEKELSLTVSRSYGPGRYDPAFEEKGMAYPVGFVPWTERRNMEEFLNLLASRRLTLDGLKGVTLPFERAPEGYELLSGKSGASPISILLEYGTTPSANGDAPSAELQVPDATGQTRAAATPAPVYAPSPEPIPPRRFAPRPLQVSFLGLGNFASTYLLPPVRASGASLERVITATPLKAETVKRRAHFRIAGTVAEDALDDPRTEVVIVATRHDVHAEYAIKALERKKAVFVEKPLALTAEELTAVKAALDHSQGRLMVGFNRRFAPATLWALEGLGQNRAGCRILCRINAGSLPHRHWLLDTDSGGGRLLGEACHFIDFACFIAGAPAFEIDARALDEPHEETGHQSFRIELSFENGATAGIDYLSNGDSSLSKERIEIHRSGTSVVIYDFRSVSFHRAGKRRTKNWSGRDKGHAAEMKAFLEAVRTGSPTPIPEEESILSTALTLAAARSIREARPIRREEW